MRNKNRIVPFLSRVDIPLLVTQLWNKDIGGPEKAQEYIDAVTKHVESPEFLASWLEDYDLRFGQKLVNDGFDIFHLIYAKEESEILMMCGYLDVESYMWASNINEDGSIRQEQVLRFIDELDDKHLKTMITEANAGKRLYPVNYVKLFQKELERRGFTNIVFTEEGKELQSKIFDDEMARRRAALLLKMR